MSGTTEPNTEAVRIDVADPTVRWRYTCPNGHVQFEPTNGGVWCESCEKNFEIAQAHHHHLIDQKTGEQIDWSRVELVENGRRL